MFDVVVMWIVTVLTFSLFFINVPYWTGYEMRDVARNGIYRSGYVLCSSVGWYMYKFIERINRKIDQMLALDLHGAAHGFINLLFYVGAVFALSNIYDTVAGTIIGGDVNDLKITDSDSYAKFSDLLLYWNIMNNFVKVNSVPSFFVALHDSLLGIVGFVISTVVYFSIMWGLLSQKVKELRLVERFGCHGQIVRLMQYEPETPSFATLPKQIVASILDFVNEISLVRNLEIIGVQIAFGLSLVGYSVMKTKMGEQASLVDFGIDLLDESGIVSTIGSFLISFLVAKATALLGKAGSKFLPADLRSTLHAISVTGNEWVDTVRRKRDQWSLEFDGVYQRTQNWHKVTEAVREMHLD